MEFRESYYFSHRGFFDFDCIYDRISLSEGMGYDSLVDDIEGSYT